MVFLFLFPFFISYQVRILRSPGYPVNKNGPEMKRGLGVLNHVATFLLTSWLFFRNNLCDEFHLSPTPEKGLCKDNGRRLSHEPEDLSTVLEETENREEKLTYGVDQGKKLHQNRD